MPYQFYPDYVPGKVIFVTIWGDFSGQEMAQCNDDCIGYLDRSGANTHILTDFRQLNSDTRKVGLLAKTFSVFAHPNMGWEVVITPNATTRFVASMVVQLVKQTDGAARYKAVATPAEALEFLAHIDPTLPLLPPFPAERIAY
jgi:hypothetical protein